MKKGDKVRLKRNLDSEFYKKSSLGWADNMKSFEDKMLEVVYVGKMLEVRIAYLTDGNYSFHFFVKDIDNREEKLKRILK